MSWWTRLLFQALLGTVQTGSRGVAEPRESPFQALLGTVQTFSAHPRPRDRPTLFQALLGTVQTRQWATAMLGSSRVSSPLRYCPNACLTWAEDPGKAHVSSPLRYCPNLPHPQRTLIQGMVFQALLGTVQTPAPEPADRPARRFKPS